MHRTDHAQKISQRFREMVEQSGASLAEEHYDELALLIEAGIDAVLYDYIEKVADKLHTLSNEIRADAEVFD